MESTKRDSGRTTEEGLKLLSGDAARQYQISGSCYTTRFSASGKIHKAWHKLYSRDDTRKEKAHNAMDLAVKCLLAFNLLNPRLDGRNGIVLGEFRAALEKRNRNHGPELFSNFYSGIGVILEEFNEYINAMTANHEEQISEAELSEIMDIGVAAFHLWLSITNSYSMQGQVKKTSEKEKASPVNAEPFRFPEDTVTVRLFRDGNSDSIQAVYDNFINLQESPAGFGFTKVEAFINLMNELNNTNIIYCPYCNRNLGKHNPEDQFRGEPGIIPEMVKFTCPECGKSFSITRQVVYSSLKEGGL